MMGNREVCRHGFASHRICEICAEVLPLEAKLAMQAECIRMAESVLRHRVNPHGHTAMEKIANTKEWTISIHCIESTTTTTKSDVDDWIAAHDKALLESIPCKIDKLSSRACQFGTKSCVVDHSEALAAHDKKLLDESFIFAGRYDGEGNPLYRRKETK